jgi:hypothetical protein
MTRTGPLTEFSPLTPDALRHLLDAELSLRARMAHVGLLIVAGLGTAGLLSLWLTEPALPTRTHAAFAVLVAINLSWSIYALRVLTRRRVLFARHRITAGRMAVTFTSVFLAGAIAMGVTTGAAAAFLAAGLGVVMLAAAVAVLARAHRAYARLTARRLELERGQPRP